MIYYTSDTHFGHHNIIGYCDRPFYNVYEMNRTITENWNAVIKPDDVVFHLGDFCFRRDTYRDFLNGNIVLIRGNHDKKNAIGCVGYSLELKIGEFNCFLTHRPVIESKYYQSDLSLLDKFDFIICGHVHNNWKVNGKNVNVGVDVWDMKPISEDELLSLLRSISEDK